MDKTFLNTGVKKITEIFWLTFSRSNRSSSGSLFSINSWRFLNTLKKKIKTNHINSAKFKSSSFASEATHWFLPFSPRGLCCSSGWSLYPGSQILPQIPALHFLDAAWCVQLWASSSPRCLQSLPPPSHYLLSGPASVHTTVVLLRQQ